MSSNRKPIPALQNEAEERDFWERHDSADYVDWDTAARVRFPNLKPSEAAAADEKANRAATVGPALPYGLLRNKQPYGFFWRSTPCNRQM